MYKKLTPNLLHMKLTHLNITIKEINAPEDEVCEIDMIFSKSCLFTNMLIS